MAAEYATFGLAPAMRAGGVLADGAYQVHRDFLDFIVDGRPLLFRLADLDAVSPLASDVPPALFAAQVRGLLLETEAPLPGGRYILYGCPECADLACGAVTAVIEREGGSGGGGEGDEDGEGGEVFVWRDFAWQTDVNADLERDGYHGIGPYRFSGPAYRAALASLLDGTVTAPRRRVLLIGSRVALLAKLAAALRTIGIGADITRDADDVPAGELRGYDAVAFGRTVPEERRAAVRAAFARAGAEVACVDGLAPIVPLLVAQIEHALDRGPAKRRRLTALAVDGGAADVEVTSPCRVSLTAYRLDRLNRARVHEVFDDVLGPGRHRIPLDAKAVKGESYVVARASGSVLTASAAAR
ncbi:oxidoreductase [Streptomyces sp. NPDC006134]|uniref:oxidoreductase n=1 Tax=Streptomyces sp. NPDC006134 TaxID=3154467 RepID=UPI0033E51212